MRTSLFPPSDPPSRRSHQARRVPSSRHDDGNDCRCHPAEHELGISRLASPRSKPHRRVHVAGGVDDARDEREKGGDAEGLFVGFAAVAMSL